MGFEGIRCLLNKTSTMQLLFGLFYASGLTSVSNALRERKRAVGLIEYSNQHIIITTGDLLIECRDFPIGPTSEIGISTKQLR